MKNTKKWFTAAAVMALSTTLAVAAPHGGKGGKHGRGGRGGDFSEKLAQKLNLTDAQKQQIKDINTAFRNENKAFFDAAGETRRQIREAREAGDTARATQLQATAESQRAQLKQLREANRQRVEAVLTAEQRAQLQALKADRGAKRSQRGQRQLD
jgi:Spy/CpxP family protein refolding chaperone